MDKYSSALLIIAVVLVTGLPGFSKTVIVPGEASTIQGGIDLAEDYDTVLVSPGIYTENISLLNKYISVMSVSGPSTTEIQPVDPDSPIISVYNWKAGSGGEERVFQPEFSGFTISGGNDSPTFYVYGITSLVISDNIFHHNIPSKIEDKAVILIQADGSPQIKRNVFYTNFGVTCIQVLEGAVGIINNTFDGNRSAFLSSSDNALVLNNIVVNSTATAIDGTYGRLDYNNVWNNYDDYG